MSELRGNQTPAERKEASDLDIARLSALRNSQTEEEKDLASGQLRARMSELRAERKEASDLDTRIVKLEAATHDEDSDDEKFDKENFEAEVNAHYRNTPNERPPEHLFKYFEKDPRLVKVILPIQPSLQSLPLT
jgi:hypothetical protein